MNECFSTQHKEQREKGKIWLIRSLLFTHLSLTDDDGADGKVIVRMMNTKQMIMMMMLDAGDFVEFVFKVPY